MWQRNLWCGCGKGPCVFVEGMCRYVWWEAMGESNLSVSYLFIKFVVCVFLCYVIGAAHISFQLTVPSSPTSEDNSALVTALSNYITSANGRPTYVQEGVAEEAAVGLAVAESWLNLTSRPSDFITRR